MWLSTTGYLTKEECQRKPKIIRTYYSEHITKVIQSRQIKEVRHVAWAGKNKVFLLNVIKAYEWVVVLFHSFLTSALYREHRNFFPLHAIKSLMFSGSSIFVIAEE